MFRPLNLNPSAWNKPFTLSAEQMAQLNPPAPTDSNLANPLKLNVTDVLLTPADGVTPAASTILDRLMHRCVMLEFEGKSYRLKEAAARLVVNPETS